MPSPKMKLELTWIGKDQRPKLEPRILIEDGSLSYAAKQRVTEEDRFDNVLIQGDNLLALKALEQEYAGKVKCIYIDPPFNTKQAFEFYDDGVEHSVWLSLMRDRLAIMHTLLAREGSLFIHIDDNELGYLIALVDEIFGRANRVSVITFKQSSVSGPKAVNPGLVTTSNFILYYAKDKACWRPGRVFVPTDRDDRYNGCIANWGDHHSEWRIEPLRLVFARSVGVESKDLKKLFGDELEAKLEEFVLSRPERVVRRARIQDKDVNPEARAALMRSRQQPGVVQMAERQGKDAYYFLDGEQLIFYSSKTRLIDGRYMTGEVASTIWDDLLSNNLHKEGGVEFPNGKKPEALLRRIFELSTQPGDLVLDSFAGSGTTGATAHKMGRRWIMVELGEQAITHVVPRLKRVIDGADSSGVTAAAGWKGGGGFRFYRLAPSLLEKDKWGNWVVSKKYNAAQLAEAICKLHGFRYEPSSTVFWQHGRSTESDFLYVTTQTLLHEQLAALSAEVGPERTLLVVCSACRGKADAFPNLTVKKIPAAILASCEWGRDDYSLNVASVMREEPKAEAASPPPGKPAKGARTKVPAGQASLFGEGGKK